MTKEGLPVPGYQPQSDAAIAAVSATKLIEERVLRHLDELAQMPGIDGRWFAIGRTEIEKGFMAVNRSIFRPKRIDLPEDK